MSSSKGSSNSNKTAHVMNLLRKSAASAPVQSEVSEGSISTASSAPASTPSATPQTPPIITALNADAEVSSQIKAALTEALEEEAHAVQPSTPPQHIPPSVPKPEAVSSEAPVAAPEEVSIHTSEIPPASIADAPISAPSENTFDAPAAPDAHSLSEADAQLSSQTDSAPDDTVLINAVWELTDEKVDKYIHLLGLCPCKRCRNDVLAITLSNLLPKYVVMSRSEFQLRYDMYSNRYDSEITSQLLRACQEVQKHPRH